MEKMDEKNINPEIDKELYNLKNENNELKELLQKFIDEKDDFLAHKLYEKARQKLFVFVGIITLALTGFGLISINTISNKISESIEKKGTENIIEDIKNSFIEKNQNAITEATIDSMNKYIEKRVEVVVKEEIQNRFEKVSDQISKPDQIDIMKAIENSYADEKYSVIVASSTNPLKLEVILNGKMKEIGSDFAIFFPNARIKPPVKGNKNYGLALGENLPFSEATKLRDRAIKLGFDHLTYLKRNSIEK